MALLTKRLSAQVAIALAIFLHYLSYGYVSKHDKAENLKAFALEKGASALYDLVLIIRLQQGQPLRTFFIFFYLKRR